jgi:hypothetical protein
LSNDPLSQEASKVTSRRELEQWLRERIARLEEELRMLRSLLAIVTGGEPEARLDPRRPRPGERVEDVRVGRKRVARVFRGEGYVRLAALEPLALPQDVREYLESVVAEIRAQQARGGREDDLATLEIHTRPDGSLEEATIRNLYNTLEAIKAKAALKHAAETAYLYTRAAEKGEEGP